jgi:hypothetical protein
MTPSEIRAELLGQHAKIRAMMDELRELSRRARAGEPVVDLLQAGVTRLAAAIVEHNLREEELLRPIIPTVDAWGAVRAEIMDESHIREHQELWDAVAGLAHTPSEFAGAGVEELFQRVLEHMEHEEKALLSEDVLHEGTVIVEPGG